MMCMLIKTYRFTKMAIMCKKENTMIKREKSDFDTFALISVLVSVLHLPCILRNSVCTV